MLTILYLFWAFAVNPVQFRAMMDELVSLKFESFKIT